MATNIDSGKLLDIFKSGALNLEINKNYIDSLNVFPVPDGDTGTNMMLTMNSTIKEMSLVSDDGMVSISKALSVGSLKGARGNSGVILSQIYKGMASVFMEVDLINTKTFSRALKQGSIAAYELVKQPKEGTILTVIRMVSAYAFKISTRVVDYIDFFAQILKYGNKILQKTPDMLPVLKKAGVVDAGGAGLLTIFEGMYMHLAGKEPEEQEIPKVLDISPPIDFDLDDDFHDIEDIKYAYCTEYFVTNLLPKTTSSDIDKLRDYLQGIGDSVLVVGDLDLIKVHVHTNNPDMALARALKLGELSNMKIENMLEQFRELHEKKELESAKKAVGLITICNGEGLKDIFIELAVDVVIEGGQTMNPSVESIAEAVEKVRAETVYILPNNPNIVLAAEQVRALTETNVVVIPSKDIPQGISAAINFNRDASVEENVEMMTAAISSMRTGMVTHAVRDTEIDGYFLKEGDIIGIFQNIAAKGNDVNQVIFDLLDKMVDGDSSSIILYFGIDVSKEDADILKNQLESKYPLLDVLIHYGGQQHYFYYVAVE